MTLNPTQGVKKILIQKWTKALHNGKPLDIYIRKYVSGCLSDHEIGKRLGSSFNGKKSRNRREFDSVTYIFHSIVLRWILKVFYYYSQFSWIGEQTINKTSLSIMTIRNSSKSWNPLHTQTHKLAFIWICNYILYWIQEKKIYFSEFEIKKFNNHKYDMEQRIFKKNDNFDFEQRIFQENDNSRWKRGILFLKKLWLWFKTIN